MPTDWGNLPAYTTTRHCLNSESDGGLSNGQDRRIDNSGCVYLWYRMGYMGEQGRRRNYNEYKVYEYEKKPRIPVKGSCPYCYKEHEYKHSKEYIRRHGAS